MNAAAISDYAVIGDGRTAALVSRDGAVDWLCLPHFSGHSIFAAILDPERGGTFRIAPWDHFEVRRRYLPDTAVLETIFTTEAGSARLTDFFPIDQDLDSLLPMREMIRVIEGIKGEVAFDILIDPRPNYGRVHKWPQNRGKLGWAYIGPQQALMIRAEYDLAVKDTALVGTMTVRPGEKRRVSLAFVENDIGTIPILGDEVDARLRTTVDWWTQWGSRCAYRGPYRDAVVRSAITLKLLTYCLSGAVVAAATTSLPEKIGGERNWDYRYCWLRDAGMTVQALVALDYTDEAESFLIWLLHATRLTWPKLRVVYDVYGRAALKEVELPHLRGFRGSKPVRIGNAAAEQRQLDVYGEIVLAANAFVAGGGTLDDASQGMLRGFGRTVCREWQKPDHGIWEVRAEPRQYTFSKMMCWLALDRLLGLADKGALKLGRIKDRFSRERDRLGAMVEARGYNAELGTYVGIFDGDQLDASLLFMGCAGYRAANDPRMRNTYDRIWQGLAKGSLIKRYGRDYDAIPDDEGAFVMLSFWAVQNLAARGEGDAARDLFERLLDYGNDVGLFAEEFDPNTGEALGNMPQAFSHTGLINAALAIEQSRGTLDQDGKAARA